MASGARADLEARGPFDRVIGSPSHFVMPGFINGHYHCELAIGPGLYQFVFERANVFIQAATGDIAEDDLYTGVLWGLVNAIKGGQTATVDMYYGRPGMPDFGCGPALRAYEDAGHAHRVRAGEPRPEPLRARARRAVPRAAAGRPWPRRSDGRRWATPGRWTTSWRRSRRLSAEWHGRDDRIRIVTAPDWTPACSDELYRRCRRVADDHGTGLITHVLETRAEMMFNLEHYGKPAVRRLADLGVLTPQHGAGALRLGDGRGARHLRRLGRGRLERPRLQPAPVQRHLPGAGHHGHGRADRVRHGRDLVLRPRGLLPGAAPGLLPAAIPDGVRAAAPRQRGCPARRRRRTGRRRWGWPAGSAASSRAMLRGPAGGGQGAASSSRPAATTPSRSSTWSSIAPSPATSTP